MLTTHSILAMFVFGAAAFVGIVYLVVLLPADIARWKIQRNATKLDVLCSGVLVKLTDASSTKWRNYFFAFNEDDILSLSTRIVRTLGGMADLFIMQDMPRRLAQAISFVDAQIKVEGIEQVKNVSVYVVSIDVANAAQFGLDPSKVGNC